MKEWDRGTQLGRHHVRIDNREDDRGELWYRKLIVGLDGARLNVSRVENELHSTQEMFVQSGIARFVPDWRFYHTTFEGKEHVMVEMKYVNGIALCQLDPERKTGTVSQELADLLGCCAVVFAARGQIPDLLGGFEQLSGRGFENMLVDDENRLWFVDVYPLIRMHRRWFDGVLGDFFRQRYAQHLASASVGFDPAVTKAVDELAWRIRWI